LTALPLKILDNVPSSGRGAGITASRHRGSTLKETIVSNMYNYFKSFFFNNSGNFYVSLLYSSPHSRSNRKVSGKYNFKKTCDVYETYEKDGNKSNLR